MVARVFAATSIAAMMLTFVRALVYDDPELMNQTLRLWAFALVFLGAGRLGITLDRRRALRRGETGFNTLIVGSGSVGHLIAQRLVDRPEMGLRPIGFLDKEPLIDQDDDGRGLPVLGAYVPEEAPNNFPRLPVRPDTKLFVWFTRADDTAALDAALQRLEISAAWREQVVPRLGGFEERAPQRLRLAPTPRSALR